MTTTHVPRPALIVLGMHRSGTSALTRVLALHGAALPAEMPTGKPDNPRGFWEATPVQVMNDRVLAALGRAWDDPRPLPRPLAPPDVLAAWQVEATVILAQQYTAGGAFVLKEPRMARLMEIWRPALESLGVAPIGVLPIRNPLEVAASLAARDGMALRPAMHLWLDHVLAAEFGTRGWPRVVVHHDTLLTNWRYAVAPVLGLLGGDGALAADAPAIDAFLTQELRHHHAYTDSVLRHPEIPPTVKLAFAEMRRHPDATPIDEVLLDLLDARFRAEAG